MSQSVYSAAAARLRLEILYFNCVRAYLDNAHRANGISASNHAMETLSTTNIVDVSTMNSVDEMS